MARLLFALFAALTLTAAPALAGDAPVKLDFSDLCEQDPEKCEVVGEYQQPNVAYVLSRFEQEDLETLELKEEFLPSILRSVRGRPF